MPLLELHDLKKSYRAPDGGRELVIDVPHFALEAEQQIALEGQSGSGKTTLLNLIAGILKADSGRVVLAGQDLEKLSESRRDTFRARHVGYVFQTFNLLQGYTALENVLMGMFFGRGPDRAFACDLLERLGLSERMTYRPHQLSIGQQQRVALARALANRPDLVLADEPTGNLDSVRAREALELVREACREQKAALLLVSHDRDVLGQFDTVVDLAEINRAPGNAPGNITGGGAA